MQTFTGADWLKIDIASKFGLDKLDWEDRISWFDMHEPDLENLQSQADEPALYYAGVNAYRQASRGKPTGYLVSLDAASSGLQILSALSGCETSGRVCGIIDTGHREAAYRTIFDRILARSKRQVSIPYEDVKQAVMTALYGSKAEPRRVFGNGDMLAVFYEVMETSLPGAWQLNHDLQALWQPYAKKHAWIMPDNFHVRKPVESKISHMVKVFDRHISVEMTTIEGKRSGLSISPDIVHSIDGMIVREMHRRCQYDPTQITQLSTWIKHGDYLRGPRMNRAQDELLMVLWNHYQQSGFLSARILALLDRENLAFVDVSAVSDLIQSLPVKRFELLSNHDCFRAHPNHADSLRLTYNQIMSEIARSDVLSFIASQVAGYYLPVVKSGMIANQVLKANYALT